MTPDTAAVAANSACGSHPGSGSGSGSDSDAGSGSGSAAILELRGLTVHYGSRAAVRDVSLSLAEGQTLGLAGESGSGKTTVGLSVLRLLPKSASVSGEVLLDGQDVGAMSWGRLRAARWAQASVVFQGAMHALNPVRRVGDQIAEPMALHGVSGSVAELLDQVELPAAKARSYPHELSGGQKQRVMIAMALACSPRLIIADEPTTALDVIVQAQVLGLLRRLVAERGLSLLMISHDLSVLTTTCDDLAVMHQGEIVERGRAAEVIASPAHPHTAALAAAFPTVGAPEFRYVERCSTLPTLLSVEDLRVSFGSTMAVDGVSLEVGRGEIVALVGESGSGKTTLARTIMGLQRPSSGRVIFDGVPIPSGGKALKAYRRQVQLVLQDPSSALNPRHSVYEAVAEGLRIHGIPGDEESLVKDAVERSELRPAEVYLSSLPHELSGGQQQRVVIAGALALQPRLLIADEPVASLDASVRGEILALLLRLRRELELAALIITHDLGLAWNIADRVAVMYQGRIVEQGTVEQVLLDPRHEYTRRLLAAVPSTTRA
ncbi:ABC transporter ATP-binding protein [Lentzea sp. NBRC 105346]|uniref:ATP-binding cassette domain-containing protein n=1 Tax=Lentzea sp. NBRC 105346 TaxID=3032205 RepID=UPI0024A5F03B|nr:ABC transporter ATP-binding protein [Lentzea sp. NBRC 105346]GLZ28317.1 ABC transporter ATP-binding protein [Lentzea sp. NBRC 105346]